MPDYQPDPYMSQRMTQYTLGQAPGMSPLAPSFTQQQYGAFGTPYSMSADELEYNNDQATYVNKLLEMQFSPEVAMLTGGTGIPHEMFEPEVTFEQIPRPGFDFLSRQIQPGPQVDPQTGQPMIDPQTGQPIIGPSPIQSYSGFIANEILYGSGSSATGIAKIRQIIQQGDDMGKTMDPNDPEYDPQYAMLKNSLPTMYDQLGQPQIDWMSAQEDATSWEQAYYEDPRPGPAGGGTSGGQIYDAEGNTLPSAGGQGMLELQYDDAGNQILVKRTETPTPIMEMFAEYGLPSPYDRYEVADFMGPDWEAGTQAYYAAQQQQEMLQPQLDRQGRKVERKQNALTQVEQDYGDMVAAYQRWMQTGETSQLTPDQAKAELPERYHDVNLDAMTPEYRDKYIAAAQAEDAARGPVDATTAVGAWKGDQDNTGLHPIPQFAPQGKPDYRPGSTLSPELAAAIDQAGNLNDSSGVYPLADDMHQLYQQLERQRRRTGNLQDQYYSNQQQMQNYDQQIQGSYGELFGGGGQNWQSGLDYGEAGALAYFANQEGRTPYTDALMARRMVPLAAGVQTGAWIPAGYP